MVQVFSYLRVGVVRVSRIGLRVNNPEGNIVANLDSNRIGHADSNCGDDDLDTLAWAAAIARVWADDLADSRQDVYTPDDGHAIVGGNLRPPSPETTANHGCR